MMNKRMYGVVLIGVLFGSSAQAAVVQSVGAGTAVTAADHVLTFDSIIVDGIDLASYSEDGLDVFAPGISFTGFNPFLGVNTGGFHYERNGNTGFVTIKHSTGARLYALEFLIGSGATNINDVFAYWEPYRGGMMTGSGTFMVSKGTIVGWSDAEGFDELHVAAGFDLGYTSFGTDQAIVLDDLMATSRSIFSDGFE